MVKEVSHVGGAHVSKDGWGGLYPAGDEGGVLDVVCGGKAKALVIDGSEKSGGVVLCEWCAKPVLPKFESDGVEFGGSVVV